MRLVTGALAQACSSKCYESDQGIHLQATFAAGELAPAAALEAGTAVDTAIAAADTAVDTGAAAANTAAAVKPEPNPVQAELVHHAANESLA